MVKLLLSLIFVYVPVGQANAEPPKQPSAVEMAVLQANQQASLTDIYKEGLEHLKQGNYKSAIPIFTQERNPAVAFETQSLLKARLNPNINMIPIDFDWTKLDTHHEDRLRSVNHYDKALADYNSALKADPEAMAYDTLYKTAAGILNKQGKEHLEAGRLDSAYKSLHLALSFYPGLAKSYNNIGLIIMHIGQWKVLNASYDSEDFYRLKYWKKAVQWYDRAILLDPTESAFYMNRGNAYSKLKAGPRAIQDFDKAIKLDPLSFLAYGNRGTFHVTQDQGDMALPYLNRAIEILHKNPEVSLNPDDSILAITYNSRGLAQHQLGMWESAIKDYESALDTPFLSSLPPPRKGIMSFIKHIVFQPHLSSRTIMAKIAPNHFQPEVKTMIENNLKKTLKARNKAQRTSISFFSRCVQAFSISGSR